MCRSVVWFPQGFLPRAWEACIPDRRRLNPRRCGELTFIVGLFAPGAVALIGFLMFGNLIRECGVQNALAETAQRVLRISKIVDTETPICAFASIVVLFCADWEKLG